MRERAAVRRPTVLDDDERRRKSRAPSGLPLLPLLCIGRAHGARDTPLAIQFTQRIKDSVKDNNQLSVEEAP